ncbi:hypothetical protein [Idiomarina abyssalis]|uniref:hypothetical protein n=1 Tax=Idiomarina abyssalis TaxID=86102 RepID=UPI0006C8B443|nr:hypothetical protein [Idiomarina abyssalis]KPD21785.1 hypothetical protein ADS78_04835 [Idiomarina abyssalis]SFT67961.1 hypothetical protein SAMN04515657_1700 [Idiomarina abyssalis]
MNKVILVPAFFVPTGKEKTVRIPTGEKTVGFWGGEKDVVRKEKQWVQTGFSNCVVDSERLSDDLSIAVEKLNQDGFEVVSVTPVTCGNYDWDFHAGGVGESSYGYGYGYGYSYTSSLIITAKKIS